jgi:hypothetical protein
MQQRSILSNLKEYIVDRWLTWRTGKSKEEREWIQWYEENVVYRAGTIPNMFMHFKHVIEVDPKKFMVEDPFTWRPCEDAQQYFWPARTLGNNAVWRFERVIWDKWTNSWQISGMGDQDKVFVATNNDRDAIMIALKYMS